MRYIGNNSADIQSETMKARRQWNGIFQELKSRIPSPGNVSFKKKGKIKNLSDVKTSREFFPSRSVLQEMLKEGLQARACCQVENVLLHME